MKGILFILFILILNGCAPQYQVVQQLEVNMYHLYNTRTGEIKIILTEENLKEDAYVKLKHIRIIAEIEK